MATLVLALSTGCTGTKINESEQGYNINNYDVKEPESSVEDEDDKIRGDYGQILAGKQTDSNNNNMLSVPKGSNSGMGTYGGAGKWNVKGGVEHPLPQPTANFNYVNGGFWEPRTSGGNTRYHKGIDLTAVDSGGNKIDGMNISCPADGIVIENKWSNSAGWMLGIEHIALVGEDNEKEVKFQTWQYHMKEQFPGGKGTAVRKGQSLGAYGGTGSPSKTVSEGHIGYATHVHMEVADSKRVFRYSPFVVLYGIDGDTWEKVAEQSNGFYKASSLANKEFGTIGSYQ